MDLLTVLEHELGHLLGYDHEEGGVMVETLTAGTRLGFGRGADAYFALLAAEEETAWNGSSLFGQRRPKG